MHLGELVCAVVEKVFLFFFAANGIVEESASGKVVNSL